ncbi:MAG: TonB-dependent receptor, partial [Janthinobacterium lividum]
MPKIKAGPNSLALVLLGAALSSATARAAEPVSPGPAVKSAPTSLPAAASSGKDGKHQGGLEQLRVLGRRQANWVVTPVDAKTIAQFVPGTNALKALTTLPGVMYNSGDPQGLNTWGTSFLMHGFTQNQIGMSLDGMPLGDQSWTNTNGLSPASAISTENIARVDVSASAGSESAVSTSNLGGTVQFVSLDPSHRTGGEVAQTFGSNSTYRTFVRLESGDVNPSGTRFYVSYARNDADKWRGGQDQFMQQVNAKLVQPIGQESKVTAFFDYSDEEMQNYQDYNLNMFNSGNYSIDNLIGTPHGYATAYQLALAANGRPGGSVPANLAGLKNPYVASYYDGAGVEREYFGGLNAELALTERLRWNIGFYGHGSSQVGTVTSPLISSPSGAPFVEQASYDFTRRFGLTSSMNYDIGGNSISGGLWFENTRFERVKAAYYEPSLAEVQNGTASPVDGLHLAGNPYQLEYQDVFNTNTLVAYLQDTYRPRSDLAFHVGMRSVLNTTRVGALANWPTYTRTTAIAGGDGLTSFKGFLPHVSGEWNVRPDQQVFFDVSQNVRVFPVSPYNSGSSPLSTTQAAYLASKNSLTPETDWNFAVGYRYNGQVVSGSLYAYHTEFSNRLQQISTGNANNPLTVIANVGAVTMNGVDAAITLRPIPNLAITNSISYDHATYDDNVTTTTSSGAKTYILKGQQVVAYPEFMYKGQLTYDWRQFELHADTQYIGTRNLSYTGDAQVPAYWLTNVGVRYDFTPMIRRQAGAGFVRHLVADFNVYNIAGAHYISGMGENGFPLSGDYQSVLLGSPRQFFFTVRAD